MRHLIRLGILSDPFVGDCANAVFEFVVYRKVASFELVMATSWVAATSEWFNRTPRDRYSESTTMPSRQLSAKSTISTPWQTVLAGVFVPVCVTFVALCKLVQSYCWALALHCTSCIDVDPRRGSRVCWLVVYCANSRLRVKRPLGGTADRRQQHL